MKDPRKGWPRMGSRVDVALWWRIPKILKSKSVDDGKGYPSFWEWEETVGFLQRHQDMFQIRVDQGALGHQRPKPTMLLSNVGQLKELDGITSNGSGQKI